MDEADKIEESEDTLHGRFLIFLIEDEMFGIEIRYVTEIIGLQMITEMPEMPVYIKGIINLRGRIIPVMDVRLRFGKEMKDYNDRTCVIVAEYNGISCGLIVDSVSEVMKIPDDNISERPVISNTDNNGFVKNIGKANDSVILLINCGKLLSSEEFADFSGVL